MKSLEQQDEKEVKKCYKEISEMSHVQLSEEHPLVLERFQIFAGLYSIEQCAKALEFNNNDVELATIAIVSESEKTPKDEKSIQLTRSTILCETEVKYVEGNRPVEK
jgi:hypothetical protein